MGLDMFLFKTKKGEEIAWVKSNFSEVAYWRKSNQIHAWFVENVQNGIDECVPNLVTKENLEELLANCKLVLSDHFLAADILPSQGGFFFGSTAYDQYYFADLRDTVDQLEKVLSETDFETEDLWYCSSW